MSTWADLTANWRGLERQMGRPSELELLLAERREAAVEIRRAGFELEGFSDDDSSGRAALERQSKAAVSIGRLNRCIRRLRPSGPLWTDGERADVELLA